MAIDQAWLKKFAYKIKQCPRCNLRSFGLIFESHVNGEVWECANENCGYNPQCSCGSCKRG